jgi:alpha-ribazole phosphatase
VADVDAALAPTTIDLLRHGACEGGEIFRGSTDVPLTAAGWAQMSETLQRHSGWQRVVCSSLQRCYDFGADVASRLDLPVHNEAGLREISFGDWEGRLIADVEREQGALLQGFWNDPARNTAPGGEPITAFRDRVLPVMDRLQEEYAGEHLLVVTHGAVIRLLLCEWLGMPYSAFARIAVPYASLTRFRIYRAPGQTPWLQLVFHGA